MVTVKDWLEDLANRTQSGDEDSTKMQNFLRHIGFGRAVVVLGIVYLEGKGTLEAPPASIHSIARMILNTQEEK